VNRLARLFSWERRHVGGDVLSFPPGTRPEVADSIAKHYEDNVEQLDPLVDSQTAAGQRLAAAYRAHMEENGAIESGAADIAQPDGPDEPGTVRLREEVSHWRRLHDEVADERDQLAGALDLERPAPNPAWLASELKRGFYRARIAPGPEAVDERWTAIAETAIDVVRGLWPPTTATATTPPRWPYGQQLAPEEIAVLESEADHRLAAREELARVICSHEVAAHTAVPWEEQPEPDREIYRAYAAAIQAHYWRGPATSPPSNELTAPEMGTRDTAAGRGDQITGTVERRELPAGAVLEHFGDGGNETGTGGRTLEWLRPEHGGPAGPATLAAQATSRIAPLPETSPDGGESAGPAPASTGETAPDDPADTAKVGDPDPTRGFTGPTCPAFYEIWVCTRPVHTRGQHVAGSGATVRATWRACPRCRVDVKALPADWICDQCEAEVEVRPAGGTRPAGDHAGDAAEAEPGPGTPPSLSSPLRHNLPRLEAAADSHIDQLARALARRELALTGVSWAGAHTAFREGYRFLAVDVVEAGWWPPSGTAPSRELVPVIAAVLTEHEPLLDDACRCGFGGTFSAPDGRSPLWHAEHVAELLIESGAIAR
jgi:hypothetical protein